MLTKQDEQIIRELRMDFKFKWMEQIMKQFFMESLEAVLSQRAEKEQPLLTISGIANRFKVSKATIHNWLNRGILKGNKVGKNRYFTEAEIQNVIHFLNK